MRAVSDRLDEHVSLLRIDSIVWQAGQVIDRHEPDQAVARAALVSHFETVGLDPEPARTLAEELTVAM